MKEPPSGTHWQFVCQACEGSKIRFTDPDDDDGEVSCGVCGVSLGTMAEVKKNMLLGMAGKNDPTSILTFRKVETKH